jgi:release factor glutamine methyltransferase
MEHLSNSKELFRTLVSHVELPESKDEIESIILMLMEKRCGLSRADILAGKKTDCGIDKLMADLVRINAHEPVQYILGEAHFFGRQFAVDQSVLIPRPETEALADEALRLMHGRKGMGTALDIGTGSGCIAITLALGSTFNVTAIDKSAAALKVAGENATRLKAAVKFVQHDFLADRKLPGTWDLMVSNPPYVRRSEALHMKANVKDYEPHLALFVPDDDPLIFYKAIANYAREALQPDGVILAEVNEFLALETRDLFVRLGYECTILKDFSNKDRVLRAQRKDIYTPR